MALSYVLNIYAIFLVSFVVSIPFLKTFVLLVDSQLDSKSSYVVGYNLRFIDLAPITFSFYSNIHDP